MLWRLIETKILPQRSVLKLGATHIRFSAQLISRLSKIMAPLSIDDDQPERPGHPRPSSPMPTIPLVAFSPSIFMKWRNYFEVAIACNDLNQREAYEKLIEAVTEEVWKQIDDAGKRHYFQEVRPLVELLETLQTVLFPGADSEERRAAFLEARQREDESTRDFLARLRRLFNSAYHDAFYLEGVRFPDQIIKGLRNPDELEKAKELKESRLEVERESYRAQRREYTIMASS